MSEADSVRILILDNRISIAATALYCYDKILTAEQEVNLIWRRKNSGIVIPAIYATMHICTALYLIITVFVPSNIPCEGVFILNVVVDIAICALYLAWGVASALRVYAIGGLDLVLPSVIMFFSLVPVAANIVRGFHGFTSVYMLMSGHQYNATSLVRMSLPPTNSYVSQTMLASACVFDGAALPVVEIVTRACSTFADALVLIATWRINGGIKKLARQMNVNVSLTSLLLRDGAPTVQERQIAGLNADAT
ncbi:hypothetical protein EVJ58_g7170 [Rhodofomes roseus]|uniref:DUF6533 domain-containing protein n=1 Tax=Rhodofomes roseus TaxID=34475 RepID=A0A4Y9Y503_9APHY|nr:hypothetical protein EVJ58_g7170 [Rhodofomes roseus]